MITLTELLRQKSVTCSCGCASEHAWVDTCYTGWGDVVDWVPCSECESVCDHLHERLPGDVCPITPCRDPEHRRERDVDLRGLDAG